MNVLAIGAHFDDVELGCGGTLAKLVRQGHTVHVYVATQSGYANIDNFPVRSSADALAEGTRAAGILGVHLHAGTFENFRLQFGDDLNTEVRRWVDSVRADMVFSVGGWGVHSDHWALARATLHAARHVPRVALYRCNWYTSEHPFHGTLYVDITETMDVKIAAIKSYVSEWKRAGEHWVDYFTNLAKCDGFVVGVPLAECFETVRWVLP